MTSAAAGLDVTDPSTAAFWAGTGRGELIMQRCDECASLRWPPGPVCPACQSFDAQWATVEPTGTLISYCVYHRAFDKAFADRVPYAVGYVQLSAGPRMHALMDGPFDGLTVDGAVEAVFVPTEEGVTFVHWRMAAEAARSSEEERDD